MPMCLFFRKQINIHQFAHVDPLQLHGGVNVAIQRDGGGGMSQDLTQGLDLKAGLHTAGGKSMPQRMKMNTLQITLFGVPFHAMLEGSGFNIMLGSGENVSVFVFWIHSKAQHIYRVGHGDYSGWIAVFLGSDVDSCLAL